MARLMRGFSRVAGFRRDLSYTAADRLEERAAALAERPFILFEDQCISFGEMNRRANQVAHAALAAGLRPGDAVALLMLNRPEYLMVWLGLAKVGIVTALVNTSATGDILTHALRQATARALIVGTELVSAIERLPQSDRPALIFEQTVAGAARSGVARLSRTAASVTTRTGVGQFIASGPACGPTRRRRATPRAVTWSAPATCGCGCCARRR